VEAIFLSGNATTSVGTRHISTRAHFVREIVLDAYLTVKFCRSRDMVADGFSNNITGDLYDHHRPSYLLSSDNLNEDVDDPNTIGRVLEYVLVDGASEARPALGANQTLMRTPDPNGPTTYTSSLRNGPLYLRDGNPRHVSMSHRLRSRYAECVS
jgi:hypothetical protein